MAAWQAHSRRTSAWGLRPSQEWTLLLALAVSSEQDRRVASFLDRPISPVQACFSWHLDTLPDRKDSIPLHIGHEAL